MSVIKTDLLQNRLGTSHPAVTKADFVKAWMLINFSTTVPVFKRNFGCSGLTDGGVGALTATLTSPMNPDFAVTSTMANVNGNTAAYAQSASVVSVQVVSSTWVLFDSMTGFLSVMVTGDLA